MAEGLFFDFDAEAADAATGALPPTCKFKLGGKEWTVRNRDEVPFEAMYAATLYLNGNGAALAVGPFFNGVLAKGEYPDFEKTITSPDITLPMVVNAAKRVLEALHGETPTRPSANSASGSKRTSRKSAGGSSSQGTHQRASGD